MIGPVWFKEKKAWYYLLQHGFVFTVRSAKRTVGETTTRPTVLRVTITRVKTLMDWSDLQGYWECSGFLDLAEWLQAIQRQHGILKTAKDWMKFGVFKVELAAPVVLEVLGGHGPAGNTWQTYP